MDSSNNSHVQKQEDPLNSEENIEGLSYHMTLHSHTDLLASDKFANPEKNLSENKSQQGSV
jgi:hypothetical protein